MKTPYVYIGKANSTLHIYCFREKRKLQSLCSRSFTFNKTKMCLLAQFLPVFCTVYYASYEMNAIYSRHDAGSHGEDCEMVIPETLFICFAGLLTKQKLLDLKRGAKEIRTSNFGKIKYLIGQTTIGGAFWRYYTGTKTSSSYPNPRNPASVYFKSDCMYFSTCIMYNLPSRTEAMAVMMIVKLSTGSPEVSKKKNELMPSNIN